jgi:hypothetical protein
MAKDRDCLRELITETWILGMTAIPSSPIGVHCELPKVGEGLICWAPAILPLGRLDRRFARFWKRDTRK